MKRKSRRISIGFCYIGFGNKQSNFNQKNDNPFATAKDRLHKASHYHFKLDFKHEKLSKEDKELIKSKIRKAEKCKIVIASIVTVVVIIILFFLLRIYLFNTIDNRNTPIVY
ncbi:hypothetical protein EYD45_03070 [Hyunsoonleella flava]|uniref:Uncharacterized protein n=1 Tax=Hyunsoonleella flava TaxID=2527939 RepID=A0A4Q9FIC9_9FLAO|nr:hypothetical protein [Hyunsoonleella flava]TBN06878.1 hypothetical protein EYD45_03070 [Hyunsoonleella flava]